MTDYNDFTDEIVRLYNMGNGFSGIADYLIDKYNLDLKRDYFRKVISRIVKHNVYDKELIEENVRLGKQKQKLQDRNRIQNKSFREHARIENAVEEYQKALLEVFKVNKLNSIEYTEDRKESSALIIHVSDLHFNELVNLEHNKYDFKIASQRLQKFSYHIKKISKLYNVNNFLIAITGDLMNSDRRLDELLAMSTNRSKATFLAVDLLQQFILDINEVGHVSVACVTGNESRLKENLGWVDITASDNYDFTIFEILRLLLSENKSIQFLQGDPLENVVRVANKNVLMIHGHQMGRNLGQSCDMLTRKYAKRNIIIDFIISGHIHECYISDLYARGGSLVGPNSYSENALNLSSRASQNLYVINNEDKIDVRIDLQNSNKFNGYNIDEKLASYNAKSFDKTKIRKSIMEIVI